MTGTLEHLDPQTLLIADNVRDDAALDAHFLASVREHGVLQPITATRSADGVEVRDGQRRTLAAREAGLVTIPVYVLDGAGTDAAERITHQIVTNDQRAALTDAQRVKGINQMLLAGVSAAKVAKALSVDRTTITAASTAGMSPTAMEALNDGQLSLTEAAALCEFDDDPAAVRALLDAAGGAMFDHRVAQLRRDRQTAQARAEAETSWAERGFTILTERPMWRDTSRVLLRYLRTADGHEATLAAVTDPTRWAVLLTEDTVLVDAATGEPVDEADVDWSTERAPDRQPEDGQRHAATVVEQSVWEPEYFCLDPAACGLALADFLASASPIVAGRDTDTDATLDGASLVEAQRAERRKVLVLNKLGLAAQDVRREFVRDKLLARKTPVKGAMVFIAGCVEQGPGLLTEHAGRQIAAHLLGVEGSALHAAVAKLTAAGDSRAQVLLLAMVLGALEARTPKDAWRSADSRYNPRPGAAEYLRFLAGHGYPLSDVERVITGELTAERAYERGTAAAD